MSDPPPPYAFEGLDRLLHEKTRLSILASLSAHAAGLSFVELKSLCGLTDGNLGRHLEALQEAGVVSAEKSFQGRRPLTTVRLTPEGRRRFLDYLRALEQVVERATEAAERAGDAESAPRPVS